jgi:hypothetical protein
MLEDAADTEYRPSTNALAQANQEVSTPSIQALKSGLEPGPTTQPRFSCRSIPSVLLPSTEYRAQNYAPEAPEWLKPYGELCDALLKVHSEVLFELSEATERAVFERFLQLAGDEGASHERQHLGRAIDVILTLKTLKIQQVLSSPSSMQRVGSSARRTTLVLRHNAKIEYRRLA